MRGTTPVRRAAVSDVESSAIAHARQRSRTDCTGGVSLQRRRNLATTRVLDHPVGVTA